MWNNKNVESGCRRSALSSYAEGSKSPHLGENASHEKKPKREAKWTNEKLDTVAAKKNARTTQARARTDGRTDEEVPHFTHSASCVQMNIFAVCICSFVEKPFHFFHCKFKINPENLRILKIQIPASQAQRLRSRQTRAGSYAPGPGTYASRALLHLREVM